MSEQDHRHDAPSESLVSGDTAVPGTLPPAAVPSGAAEEGPEPDRLDRPGGRLDRDPADDLSEAGDS